MHAGIRWGYSSGTMNRNAYVDNITTPFSVTISGLDPGTLIYYRAYVVEYVNGNEVDRQGEVRTFTTKKVATATVTTGSATATSAGATLQGSWSGATGTVTDRGFYWGTTQSSIQNPTTTTPSVSLGSASGTSGSLTGTLSSLESSKTYYYRAYVVEFDEAQNKYVDRLGTIESFTTSAASQQPTAGWLELPSYTTSGMSGTTTSSLGDLYSGTHKATMNGKSARNYSYLYDPEMYASYWIAYPLCYAHKNGSGRSEAWAYDPDVPQSKQTNLTGGSYGVNISSSNYSSNLYSRGHQIANSDRNGVGDMADQTYYMTNITPQIQNGFNGGIWNNLEQAVQALTSSCDTVYVVTGAAFKKKGGSETVKTIVNTRDNKTIPVPNYYWKALLKVTRDSGGTVTSASAIGFWLPHQEIPNDSYTSYTVTVDQIETWTGFDLFANLPDSVETSAEQNTKWTTFQNF